MPSPFPGMDPYLEDQWSAVHVLMMSALTAALKRRLPAGLAARPEESVRIESTGGDRLYDYRPDLAEVEGLPTGRPAGGGVLTARPAPVAEPVGVIRRPLPIVTRNVQIVDVRNADRVVTVIEVLGPGNKAAGRANDDYRMKLADYEEAGASWVELDLLRSSRQRLPVPWADLPAGTVGDYLAVVYRHATGRVVAYPIGLRDRLPTIAVPLRIDEADVPLDLQGVFDRVYDDGPFDDTDYGRPADPPLSAADAAWAADRVAGRA